MKVDVITVEMVQIKKWRFWSSWIDVAVFQHGYSGYLLQMRIGRNNAKQFTAREMAGHAAVCDVTSAGDLTQMNKKGGEG